MYDRILAYSNAGKNKLVWAWNFFSKCFLRWIYLKELRKVAIFEICLYLSFLSVLVCDRKLAYFNAGKNKLVWTQKFFSKCFLRWIFLKDLRKVGIFVISWYLSLLSFPLHDRKLAYSNAGKNKLVWAWKTFSKCFLRWIYPKDLRKVGIF